ncbi:MAG: hypothetical protein ACXVGO_09495 [Mycobacterium sp.]
MTFVPPTPYVPFQDYSAYQAAHQLPGPALQGTDLNAEFSRLKTTTDALIANLNLIQRNDGALANQSVTPDTINSALAILIAGWNIRGAWVTATSYALKDYVTNGGNGYVCIIAHTGGVFATDLAAGKWALVATAGPQGIQGPQGNPGAAGAPGITRPSFVNRLINGDFSIDQRNEGTSKTYTAAGNVAYGIDRWYASCTGANVTAQRVTGTGVNQFAYQFTGLASNTGIVFGQRIEAANIFDQASQSVTVQVWLSSSSITTVTWKTFAANTIDAWGTKTTSGTGTETQIDTGTLTITSTPTLYTFTTNLGANAGRGIDLEFSFGALLAAQTIKFEAIQLEPGTIANTFERPDFQTRLIRCERYYEKSPDVGIPFPSATRAGAYGSPSVSGSATTAARFRATKRATPTVTICATGSATVGDVRDVTGGADLVGSQNAVGMRGFAISSTTTAGNYTEFHMAADAEL